MITKTDFLYMKILFLMWQVTSNYSALFYYAEPETPFDMYAEIKYIKGVAHIMLYFPTVHDYECDYSSEEQREIMQMYLNYSLLPQFSIPPYRAGDTINDITESLYIDYAGYDYISGNCYIVDVVHICDPVSYNYFRSKQPIPTLI